MLLLNTDVLGEIVSHAEQLNVPGDEGRATAAVGDDVVEMKVVGAATLDASTAIAFPDLELDRCRDEAAVTETVGCGGKLGSCVLIKLEPELEDHPAARLLALGIDEGKDAVIDADPGSNLLVDPDTLGGESVLAVLACGLEEDAVLCVSVPVAVRSG